MPQVEGALAKKAEGRPVRPEEYKLMGDFVNVVETAAQTRRLAILEKQGVGNSFTSFLFHDLFEGRSSNSAGFLNAILLNEKVVRLEEGKKRKYVFNSPSALLARINKAKPRRTVKKAARKPAK